MKINEILKEQGVTETSFADQIMAAAKAAGLNARVAGTPEQERARTQQMLAQRAKERQEREQQAALADIEKLPELKTKYEEMKKLYRSLGGSNWQYADREQNLSDAERKARSMEPELNRLAAQIHRAEQSQGVAEGGNVFAPGIENSPAYKAGFATGKLPVPHPEGTQEYAAYYKGVIDRSTPTLNKGVAEEVDTGEYDARKTIPSSKEKNDEVFRKHRERMKALDKDEQGVAEDHEDNPVVNAITRRIMIQRPDLLKQYGPVAVGQAIDEVADFVGGVEEIGSSDVSAWVRQVEQMLQNNPPEAFGEGVMSGIDIEYQDYKTLSPREFFNIYKITKKDWAEKYKTLLPKEAEQQPATASLTQRLQQLESVNSQLEQKLSTMSGRKKSVAPEVDYDDPAWDEKVRRLGKMAKEGPRKIVWDPEKRVYKTVPINPVKENDVGATTTGQSIADKPEWAERMRAIRDLQKDVMVMRNPKLKAAVQQRMDKLLKFGLEKGYVK